MAAHTSTLASQFLFPPFDAPVLGSACEFVAAPEAIASSAPDQADEGSDCVRCSEEPPGSSSASLVEANLSGAWGVWTVQGVRE